MFGVTTRVEDAGVRARLIFLPVPLRPPRVPPTWEGIIQADNEGGRRYDGPQRTKMMAIFFLLVSFFRSTAGRQFDLCQLV